MTDDEIEFFRKNIRRILQQIFLDKPIGSATAYFSIWHELRKVLEEELSITINTEVQTEIDKIKSD